MSTTLRDELVLRMRLTDQEKKMRTPMEFLRHQQQKGAIGYILL